MNSPKYFICPMSKNIVDSILELKTDKFGFTVTRRQIDYKNGYVNNWNTKTFVEYIKKNSNLIIERDHGGPNQGFTEDDGTFSFQNDADLLDIIHIDPFVKYKNKIKAIKETSKLMGFIYSINQNVKFEIGTEEAIVQYNTNFLDEMLDFLKDEKPHQMFENVEFVVIQTGLKIDLVNKNNHTNSYRWLKEMVNTCKKYNKKVKEHNGDYLTNNDYELRFEAGVDSINIGPEIAQIETSVYLENMSKKQKDEFYKICLESEKWKRWGKDIDTTNKDLIINVCGHYNYSKYDLPKIDEKIKEKIKEKLLNLP